MLCIVLCKQTEFINFSPSQKYEIRKIIGRCHSLQKIFENERKFLGLNFGAI